MTVHRSMTRSDRLVVGTKAFKKIRERSGGDPVGIDEFRCPCGNSYFYAGYYTDEKVVRLGCSKCRALVCVLAIAEGDDLP